MTIQQVTKETFPKALAVYRRFWKESYKDASSAHFLKNLDYAGHLEGKAEAYLACDPERVCIFSAS